MRKGGSTLLDLLNTGVDTQSDLRIKLDEDRICVSMQSIYIIRVFVD